MKYDIGKKERDIKHGKGESESGVFSWHSKSDTMKSFRNNNSKWTAVQTDQDARNKGNHMNFLLPNIFTQKIFYSCDIHFVFGIIL